MLLDPSFDALYAAWSILVLWLLLPYVAFTVSRRKIGCHPVSRWVAVDVSSLGLAAYLDNLLSTVSFIIQFGY